VKIGYLMQAGVPDVRQFPLSGPANHVKQVITELNGLGHQVRLIMYKDGQIFQSDNLVNFERVSLRWLNSGLFRLFESAVRRIQSELRLPYAALFESFRFASACRQALPGYDVFYERMGWVGYGGVWAAKCLKIPIVLEVNGDHLSELETLGMMPRGIQLWLSTFLVRRAVRSVAHVVATGEGWRERFIERWGVLSDLVTVIENGSEIVGLLPQDRLRAFSKEPPSKTTTILYIGAFEPWHGVNVLIKAVAGAVSSGRSLKLILIGSGSCDETLRQMVDELNLRKVVTFTGYLPLHEVGDLMAQADIGVSPYCGRIEYSGLKLLDYKSAGLAVIASGQNGQPAILEHGKTGWIVPPCDENVLSEAMILLSADTTLRKKLGQAARIDAENRHTWTNTARSLDRLFSRVTAK